MKIFMLIMGVYNLILGCLVASGVVTLSPFVAACYVLGAAFLMIGIGMGSK